MWRKWCGGLLLVAALMVMGPAHAHRRYFTFTYDWFTPARNEKEMEVWWTQERAGKVDGWLEFEYGLTDRWVIAPYLLTEREHGGTWDVNGWKLEQRYRLGSFKERRLLPALYLEVKKENSEPYELEGKIITSFVTPRWVLSSNLILEQELTDGEPMEWGYATGISTIRGRGLRAGAELFGSFTKREHYAGPMLAYSLGSSTHMLLTTGLGLNHNSEAKVRLVFEKEWR
ncbi:MAG: hypothetical protein HY320_05505 [Armatimonadetes bacterium]|nr:hypothetical protein [Armatimonadota bacterium]